MRTVLRSTATRAGLCLALAGLAGAAVAAPALASSHQVRSGHPGRAPATVGDNATDATAGVEIGTAVKFVRTPDGTVRQTRP
ncbi:MAG: hypothetical protein M3Z02_05355 [Actinomycetota bacterium]|nr:hypothetical protein [Actinomycetota bacterium]